MAVAIEDGFVMREGLTGPQLRVLVLLVEVGGRLSFGRSNALMLTGFAKYESAVAQLQSLVDAGLLKLDDDTIECTTDAVYEIESAE